ncbi:hypothetical protein LUZ60_001421 [Juncus effusus]|nr:hypothetical protein LUZ60_001421 [Juncus effusus]
MASSSLIERNTTSSSSRISRQWSDLSYNLLVSIFSRLSSTDLIVGVSSVCSSWQAAARDKNCWRIVDISDSDSIDLCDRDSRIPVTVTSNQVFNRLLRFANGGRLVDEVYLPDVSNGKDLILVAERLPNLVYLSFPSSDISQEEIHLALTKFKSLKGIAVSRVFLQDIEVLLHLSTDCPDISELKFLGREFSFSYYVPAIVRFFPKLRKLEMRDVEIRTGTTLILLNQLQHLEYLDISGCDESAITKEVIEKASRLKVFIWRSNRDLGEFVE